MVLSIGYRFARAKIFRVSAMQYVADSGIRENVGPTSNPGPE